MRLIMWVGRAGLVLLACVMTLPVQAQGYVADWAEARWQVKSGAFGCSLSHEIPGFGEAVLERNSGQAEVLSLRPRSHKGFPRGLVSLQSLPPAWRADLAGRPLGQQSIAAGEVLRLGGGLLTSVLAELKQGQLVMFSSAGQADGSTLLVSLSPNRFAPAYANFSRCVEQLIPYTFAEIARITLYYQAEAEALNARAKGELDKVARYTKADRQVLGILVDAHSDAREDQTQSLEVSRLQATLVTDYLVARGIAAERITSRWHGDQYPAATNASEQGRAQNRRITVRLENAGTRQAMEKRTRELRAQDEAKRKAEQERLAGQAASASSAGGSLTLKELEQMVESQDLRSGQQPAP